MQWEDYGEDRCDNNLISWNTIETNGNECMEAKEGSSGNTIEHNVCSNQDDSESGCYGSRGDANTIRYIISGETSTNIVMPDFSLTNNRSPSIHECDNGRG